MQHKAQHRLEPGLEPRLEPWGSEQPRLTSADVLFTPPKTAKSGYAMQSPASKVGAILLLLAISSVAAVGVFMPEEEKPLATSTKPTTSKTYLAGMPHNATQKAYVLAYELAEQRVTTVAGLTRQQRLDAMRQALAQLLGGDASQLDSAATTRLARRAPETMKRAALRGVTNGEAAGISTQSQLVIERMLSHEDNAQSY